MGTLRWLGISVVLGSLVWTLFTWPLPKHLFDGVPTSSRNIELGAVRAMIPSDQLQLMYHFWLFQDMLALQTPWFHNVYEFNAGNDRERFWPSAYFFPFSLLYAVFAWAGGRAFGMNAVGWIAICLTWGFTWRLVRRLGMAGAAAWSVAAVAILFPYRWVSQLGGSPGGYAMMYVPLIALGIDVAIRDRKPLGGIIAGGGLLLCCFGDVQVFYFCTLSLPFWFAVFWLLGPSPGTPGAATASSGCAGPAPSAALRTFVRRWPPTEDQMRRLAPDVDAWARAFLFLLAGVMLSLGYRSGLGSVLEQSTMKGGRRLEEVALFSAHWQGLFSWENLGVQNHVYVGFAACGLLAGAGVWMLSARRTEHRAIAVYALLLMAVGGVIGLALGTNGPFDGVLLRAARKWVPHYDLIRQPARVLCMLPTFLAVAMSIAGATLPGGLRRNLALVAGLALFVEYGSQVRATVCLLDRQQGGYQAVAEEARGEGVRPAALVVPLWPGDSDLSSLYQYYASLYRVRLVNGYSPVVSHRYLDDVFSRFVSVNQGVLNDGQLDELRARGVPYILVHENAFPEKVSPFPVSTTLSRLLDHPRLRLLRQEGPVWAFRILNLPRSIPEPQYGYSYFPAPGYRDQEMERQAVRGGVPVEEDPSASGGCYAVLNRDGAAISLRKPWYSGSANRLRWEVRLRGEGWIQVRHSDGTSDADAPALQVDAPAWEWRPLFAPQGDGLRPMGLELTWSQGRVEVDRAYLTGGWWPVVQPGRLFRIPAAAFFHAGYSDVSKGEVFLRKDYEPHGAIVYGPHLPLEPGAYEAELTFRSDVQDDRILGRWRVVQRDTETLLSDMRSTRPARGRFSVGSNLPIRLEFDYARTADVCLQEVFLSRLVSEQPRHRGNKSEH